MASWFFILLSVTFVITAFVHFWPYIDYVVIGKHGNRVNGVIHYKHYTTAIGTVGASFSSLSKSNSESPATSFATAESKTAEIRFVDEDDNFFQITIHPVFLNVKAGKKIPVKYFLTEWDKESVQEQKLNKTSHAIKVNGAPIPLQYHIARPILFLIAAVIAFILRYVPLFILNSPGIPEQIMNATKTIQ